MFETMAVVTTIAFLAIGAVLFHMDRTSRREEDQQ
jgi:hypothetical protein